MPAADGGGGYDTHREAPFTQSRNFINFMNAMLPQINKPGENDPKKIDLDKTMVILNMEFGRAPGAQNNGNGRNHWPYGYVQIYFGGSITKAQKGVYGSIDESGQASIFTTPTENRIAALLAQEARLLLLDEPANHLDPGQQLESYRLLGELWRTGLGILLVTHDVNLLSAIGDAERLRVAGLNKARLEFEARLDDAALPKHLTKLFGLSFASITHGGRRLLVPAISDAESTA